MACISYSQRQPANLQHAYTFSSCPLQPNNSAEMQTSKLAEHFHTNVHLLRRPYCIPKNVQEASEKELIGTHFRGYLETVFSWYTSSKLNANNC